MQRGGHPGLTSARSEDGASATRGSHSLGSDSSGSGALSGWWGGGSVREKSPAGGGGPTSATSLTPLSSLGATSRYIPYPSFLYPGENPKSFGLRRRRFGVVLLLGGAALGMWKVVGACVRFGLPVAAATKELRWRGSSCRVFGGDLVQSLCLAGCLVWWPAKLLVEARVQRWSCSSLSSRATWPMLCIRALG